MRPSTSADIMPLRAPIMVIMLRIIGIICFISPIMPIRPSVPIMAGIPPGCAAAGLFEGDAAGSAAVPGWWALRSSAGGDGV
jgi:hypothetical protein